jgi:hypothetical protein
MICAHPIEDSSGNLKSSSISWPANNLIMTCCHSDCEATVAVAKMDSVYRISLYV